MPVRVRSLLTAVLLAAMTSVGQAQFVNVIFSEDFQGLAPALQPAIAGPKGEGPGGQNSINPPDKLGWTHTTPAGWSRDTSNVWTIGNPTAGVQEWEGWSFATLQFWTDADQQRRQEFQNFNTDPSQAMNIVAVADPDEWDDFNSPTSSTGPGQPNPFYGTSLITPAINIAGSTLPLAIEFDSSWRPEGFDDGPTFQNNQTAEVFAIYDGVAESVLLWDSNPAGPNFKPDATNETVLLNLNAPAGTQEVVFAFQLRDAANDWWWAVDNIRVGTVPEPTSLGLVLGGLALLALRRRS